MPESIKATLGDIPGKKGMVVSHERSGTHFLMNALALNFGYIAQPWINFDYDLGLNFHSARGLQGFFEQMKGHPILNLVKSHHQFAFFSDFFEGLADDFHVFYVYRNPQDVMASFWRFVDGMEWDEGPREPTVGAFMRAAPRGNLLRYQKDQLPTMLHRWQAHVEGWLGHDDGRGVSRIIPVRYEDLDTRFEETMVKLGERIGRPVASPARPDKFTNVILPGPAQAGALPARFSPHDLEFLNETVGETIGKLEIDREGLSAGSDTPRGD